MTCRKQNSLTLLSKDFVKFHFNRMKGSFSNEAAVLSGFSGVVWAWGCELYWVKCRGNSKRVNIKHVNITILKQ